MTRLTYKDSNGNFRIKSGAKFQDVIDRLAQYEENHEKAVKVMARMKLEEYISRKSHNLNGEIEFEEV